MKKRVGRKHRACGEIAAIGCPRNRCILTVGNLLGGIIAYADNRLAAECLNKTRKALLAEKEFRPVNKGLVQCHDNLFCKYPAPHVHKKA